MTPEQYIKRLPDVGCGEDVYHLPAEENSEGTNKAKISTRSTFKNKYI